VGVFMAFLPNELAAYLLFRRLRTRYGSVGRSEGMVKSLKTRVAVRLANPESREGSGLSWPAGDGFRPGAYSARQYL